MGVGAAIAIGSHAENGNCALLEHPAIVRRISVSNEYSIFMLNVQFDDKVIIPIESKIKISPMRLLNRVMVPDEAAEKFW